MNKIRKESAIRQSNLSQGPAKKPLALAARSLKNFPIGLSPHIRYLSEWDDNKVSIAVGHFRTPNDVIRVFDLDEVTLQCTGKGIYSGVVKLTNFPNFVQAIKAALNRALSIYHSGKPAQQIPSIFHRCCAVLSYLVQNGYYHLADCPRTELNSLAKGIATKSLLGVMDLDHHLRGILASLTPSTAAALLSSANVKEAGIKTLAVEQALGFYASGENIPPWFREGVAAKCGRKNRSIKYRPPTPNAGDLKNALLAVNCLALHPQCIDSFAYVPFPKINEEVKGYFKEPGSQTPNIKPTQFADLTANLLSWVIDYGPHVVTLVREFRQGVAEVSSGVLSEYLLQKRIFALHAQLVQSKLLPGPPIVTMNGPQPGSLQYAVRMTMTACGSLIASNHARRANEIFGHREPYGMYFGCLTQAQEGLIEYSLDAYVQKGLRDYHRFPANSLVASSIEILESLYNLTRLLDEPELVYSENRADGRSNRLFLSRMFTVKSFIEDKRHEFWHRDYLPELLRQAGIDPGLWHESQMPFRRHFITLHLYRYDLPEPLAIQRQAGHEDLGSTMSYQADYGPRKPGETVRELHGRATLTLDSIAMLDALAAGKREYLEDGVRRLFEGTFNGGIFARVILALVKRLSRDASFAQLSVERKASAVAQKLQKRGYRADAMPHTVCMAGDVRHSRRAAVCYKDGALHREDATRVTCSGCVHSWSNANYLRSTKEERDRCRRMAEVVNILPAIRDEYLSVADELDAVIKSEEAISDSTASTLEAIVSSWNSRVVSRIEP